MFSKNILSTTPSPYSYYSQAKRTYTPIQSVFIENICYSYYTIFLLGKQGQSKVCQIKKRYSRQAISVPMINFSNKKDSQTHPTILGLVRRRQPLFYIILYYICIKMQVPCVVKSAQSIAVMLIIILLYIYKLEFIFQQRSV